MTARPDDAPARELSADEISGSAPVPVPTADPLTMSDQDLLVEALRDAEAYRALAQQAIHALHDLTIERDRLRESHHHLIAEYRRLRESIFRAEAA